MPATLAVAAADWVAAARRDDRRRMKQARPVWAQRRRHPAEIDEKSGYRQLAEAYVVSMEQGKSALIVSPTWKEIREITTEVRRTLKHTGRLQATDTDLEVYNSLNWTRAQKRDLRNYCGDHVLWFHRATAEVSRGECLRVLRREEEAVVVARRDGAEVRLTRKQTACFEVMETRVLPVAVGETLLLEGNLKSHGLFNGKCVQVRALRPDGTVELVDGRTIPPEFRTFTHGYCLTSVAAQGRTTDHVYVAVSSDSFQAANRNQFYVSVSRGREQIQVFTDDVESLRSAVRRDGKRLAAVEFLEAVRQHTGEAVRRAGAAAGVKA